MLMFMFVLPDGKRHQMDVASNSTLMVSKEAEVTKIFILSLVCVHKKVCTLPLLINKMFNQGKLGIV